MDNQTLWIILGSGLVGFVFGVISQRNVRPAQSGTSASQPQKLSRSSDQPSGVTQGDFIGSFDDAVRGLVREGKVIDAIKMVRQKTGLDLKGAKDYVERL